MRCPRCKQERDVLQFRLMEVVTEYEDVCNPILRCPSRPDGCGWLFSPGLSTSELNELYRARDELRRMREQQRQEESKEARNAA